MNNEKPRVKNSGATSPRRVFCVCHLFLTVAQRVGLHPKELKQIFLERDFLPRLDLSLTASPTNKCLCCSHSKGQVTQQFQCTIVIPYLRRTFPMNNEKPRVKNSGATSPRRVFCVCHLFLTVAQGLACTRKS
ncbi:hypothetical protein CDAR_171811 [Caerostris darwini]|uniref:Uncharacterized protein n=1 Tax=Caerostris darwini TaxID=1538125 RepID=A0AAV4MMJ0_9ARAC|nr:hypothetical protein CDAR_171811 [Caerostris darwini]